MSDPRVARAAELREQLTLLRGAEEAAKAFLGTPGHAVERDKAWQRLRELLAAPWTPERALWTLGAISEVVYQADWPARTLVKTDALREQIRKLEAAGGTEPTP